MPSILRSRAALGAIAIAAVLLVASFTIPAFAGRTAYSALSAKKTAKKALKTARTANSRSKQALALARKKSASGKTGARGRTGKTGKTGKAGLGASSAGSSGTSVALSGTPNEVLSAQIKAPAQGRILASASVELTGNGGDDDEATCWLNRGDGSSGSDISQRLRTAIPDTSTDRQTVSLDGATVQNAGTYTIKVYCTASAGDVTFIQGNLNLVAADD